jgi:hypothetical protein
MRHSTRAIIASRGPIASSSERFRCSVETNHPFALLARLDTRSPAFHHGDACGVHAAASPNADITSALHAVRFDARPCMIGSSTERCVPSRCRVFVARVRFVASSRRFTCTVVLHRRISGARRLNAWSPRGHARDGSAIRRGRRPNRAIASPPGARQVRRARRRFLRVGKVAAPANSSIRRSRRPGRHRELHRELLSTEPRALSFELADSGLAVARSHRESQRELKL